MSLSGSQSSVKFVTINGIQGVTKTSKVIDYTIELESLILKRIELNSTIPHHFAKLLTVRHIQRKGVRVPQMTMARVDAEEEFNDLIRRNLKKSLANGVETVISLACITLCACEKLRREIGVVHNDLHTSNILIVKTEQEMVEFEFDGTKYKYKTFGYLPVIIDFGYSFVSGEKMLAPPFCMDIGYATDEPDFLADARVLLTKISSAMRKYNGHRDGMSRRAPTNENGKKFIEMVETMFGPIKLDENGWFPTDHFCCVIDELLDVIFDEMKDTKGVFNDDAKEAEDLINLIISQLHPPTDDDFAPDTDARIKDDANALTTFKAFKEEAMMVAQFSSVGVVKQLALVKEWLSTSIENIEKKNPNHVAAARACKLVVESFKPIVYDIIRINRKEKKTEYAKLTVSNTLDVLQKLNELV